MLLLLLLWWLRGQVGLQLVLLSVLLRDLPPGGRGHTDS